MLLLVVAASAVNGSRWSVCHGGCGSFTVAAFGQLQDCGARSPLAAAVVEAGCSCCARVPETSAASESGAASESVGRPVGDARQAGCCDADESEAPEPTPSGALLSERPECCSVLELGLAEGRVAEGEPSPLEVSVAWSGVAGWPPPAVQRTARHRLLGRAPPRVDRISALRACTVLRI